MSNHVTHQPLERRLFVGCTDEEYLFDLWHARRIAYRRNFQPESYPSDITIANWAHKWTIGLSLPLALSAGAARTALDEARRFSLSFFYWMQSKAPRDDGGAGYRDLRLRGDVLGTGDGFAKQTYFKDGRRIRAEFTVLGQPIGVEARKGLNRAKRFSTTASALALTGSTSIPARRASAIRSISIPIRWRSLGCAAARSRR